MKILISPSILSADFSKLGDEIKNLDNSSADYVHVDVMDGHLVPNITIGPQVVKSLRPFTKKVFDVHLMISKPEDYVEAFAKAGSDIIGIHEEITGDKIAILKKIRELGCKSEIVYNPDTSINDIEKYFPYIDQILIMSVFPGFGGQKFIENSLDKGKIIRDKITKTGAKIDLEIDGGVTDNNCQTIIDAGFNVLVSGSTIYKAPDMDIMIENLRGNN